MLVRCRYMTQATWKHTHSTRSSSTITSLRSERAQQGEKGVGSTNDMMQCEDVLRDHQQIDGAKEHSQDEGQDHRTGEVLVVHLVVLLENIGTEIVTIFFL